MLSSPFFVLPEKKNEKEAGTMLNSSFFVLLEKSKLYIIYILLNYQKQVQCTVKLSFFALRKK